MKLKKFIKSSLLTFVAVGLLASGLIGTASAAQIPYVPGEPLPAPTTPAFNIYTNVPAGVGNEADFVKLRKSNGDPTVPAATSNFIDPVNADCKVGDQFDIRTYVHNGANEDFNNNGSGTAVAHNVKVAMNAPLNTTSKTFSFTSSISASNAATVNDSGKLNCADNVQLELVPKTVRVYSQHYGWKNGPDSAVNGNLKIGSRELGSGDVWGCWPDRVVLVYVVKVKEAPKPPVPPTPVPPTVTPVKPTPKQPEILPVTGPESVIGIFAAVTIAGTIAYRVVWARRELS
jgi:hypothetical protein